MMKIHSKLPKSLAREQTLMPVDKKPSGTLAIDSAYAFRVILDELNASKKSNAVKNGPVDSRTPKNHFKE